MLHLKKLFPLIVGLFPFLTGCEPFTSIRGNLPDLETLAKLKVGEQTQADVIAILGPPTSVAPFNPKIWYYIGEKVERVAFLDPDIVEKEIFMLTFNDAGVLEGMSPIETPHNFDIEVQERKTKTLGQDPSLLQQVFGNFGKFSREKESKK